MLKLLTVAQVGLIVHDAQGALVSTNSRYFSEQFLRLITDLPDFRRRTFDGEYGSRFSEIS